MRMTLRLPSPLGESPDGAKHRCPSEQSKEYIMKKILFIAILAGAAYFGYKKFAA